MYKKQVNETIWKSRAASSPSSDPFGFGILGVIILSRYLTQVVACMPTA